MADRTLLDYVQDILNESSGDEVNSISDTLEATTIARLVKQVYLEMVDELALPSTRKICALTGLGDLDKPTYMQIPQEVSNVEWIQYDCRTHPDHAKDYHRIELMVPHDFVQMVNQRPSDDTDNYQIVMSDANVPLIIGRKHCPQFCTSFDDTYIVFDSYDFNVESTLQSSKSICYAEFRPDFTLTDTFVPSLPDHLTNVLYIQALNRYNTGIRETVNPKTERVENRMRVRTMRNKARAARYVSGPDYGR